MFKNLSLQSRMIAAFLFMGLIVLIVALVGYSGNSRLSQHIDILSNNSLPSISGLWKVNEGQTQVQSSERALLNPLLSKQNRQIELNRIQKAWQQINNGFEEYESTPKSENEEQLYKPFFLNWQRWEQDHQKFMRIYQQFHNIGIYDPITVQVKLLNEGKKDSLQMANIKTAITLLQQLNILAANEESISFYEVEESVLDVVKLNYDFATKTRQSAANDVNRTTFWVIVGMAIGPITAVIFGIYFSITIAKPLGAKITAIVNTIVASSAEIAATVEQQERTVRQQAVSVNQTTTSMGELGASSQQSAEQASAATTGARQALNRVEQGTQAVEQTLEKMAKLKEKVEGIAEQISRLSQQTNQIGNISGLVSELANQTNMLALNAAVEAVRAGEHGKGFGVVASEIRKLADRSKKSADKINILVGDIQNAISSTVMVTDEGSKTVEIGVKIAEQTSAAFSGIASSINEVFLNSQEISLNIKEQAVAIQQVFEAMNILNLAAKETAIGIAQVKDSTQKFNEIALILKTVV
ncbi:MAG TPA: methyl-accepting chemotaxis protein [Leptolyngbyaceae cyanobacterium]